MRRRRKGGAAGSPGRAENGAVRWRPITTVAVFSALPFVLFLNENRSEAELDLSLVLYTFVLLVPGLVLVGLAWRTRGAWAGERAAVVFAVVSFVLFKFEAVRSLLDAVGLPISKGIVVAVWSVVLLAAVIVAYLLSRWRLTSTYVLAAGALLTAVPTVQYAHFELTEREAAAISRTGPRVPDAENRARPDVYYFLLDGYARADQLRKWVGYDNSGFLEALRQRGFDVGSHGLSPYTVTFVSTAATFLMDYPVTAGTVTSREPFYNVILGHNPVVRSFHRLGYDFAFGSDFGSLGCDGIEDFCIGPAATGVDSALGDREWAILRATPLATVLPRLGIHPPLGGSYARRLFPNEVVEEVGALPGHRPIFTFAHIVAPHPPYRYTASCQPQAANPSLYDWGDPDGRGGGMYADAVRCINKAMLRAVDAILEDDPDAVIAIGGDHGSGFGLEGDVSASSWSDALLRQRFSALNTLRVSPDCRVSRDAAELTVNIFRVILGCVATKTELRLLPSRHYAVDYRQKADVVPVPASRLR